MKKTENLTRWLTCSCTCVLVGRSCKLPVGQAGAQQMAPGRRRIHRRGQPSAHSSHAARQQRAQLVAPLERRPPVLSVLIRRRRAGLRPREHTAMQRTCLSAALPD